jgi:UDP-N-acetylglucosamine 2-epimerase (non-hydrolysing)
VPTAQPTIYFPVHPRTEKNIGAFGLGDIIRNSNIKTMPPQAYLEFLSLWRNASLVLTDSGGLQEETTALGIPCFTIRENTERPVTIEEGTNTLSSEQPGKRYSQHTGNSKKGTKRPGGFRSSGMGGRLAAL